MTTNGNGNGTLRRWLLGIASTVVAAVLLAAVYGLFDLRDRVASMEGQKTLPDRVSTLEQKMARIETTASQGARFTRADGDKLEERVRDLEREMRRR